MTIKYSFREMKHDLALKHVYHQYCYKSSPSGGRKAGCGLELA